MKNSIKNILMLTVMLVSFTSSIAQIKNKETVSEKIVGNCGMCEKNIEKAGNLKNVASVDWDKETKMAMISFDAKKTNKEEILKRIALAGYDSDSFLAPEEAYSSLPNCCQYERVNKTASVENTDMKMEMNKESMADMKAEMKSEMKEKMDMSKDVKVEKKNENKNEMKMEMKEKMDKKMKSNEKQKQLVSVYTSYFGLKDALVASDAKLTSKKASELLTSIDKVDMKVLNMDVHMVWMKILKPLKEEVKAIASSKNMEDQRMQFMDVSENMFKLMKADKFETPVYFQHCPMANNGKGANWLSKENEVKNPYYGSKMLTCGKTIETIKN